MNIKSNPHAMHKVILWVEADVHELLETGECSGNVGMRISRFPIEIKARNLADATKKINETIEELKQRCKTI